MFSCRRGEHGVVPTARGHESGAPTCICMPIQCRLWEKVHTGSPTSSGNTKNLMDGDVSSRKRDALPATNNIAHKKKKIKKGNHSCTLTLGLLIIYMFRINKKREEASKLQAFLPPLPPTPPPVKLAIQQNKNKKNYQGSSIS